MSVGAGFRVDAGTSQKRQPPKAAKIRPRSFHEHNLARPVHFRLLDFSGLRLAANFVQAFLCLEGGIEFHVREPLLSGFHDVGWNLVERDRFLPPFFQLLGTAADENREQKQSPHQKSPARLSPPARVANAMYAL